MDCCTHEKQGDKDTGVTREKMQLRGWRTCLLSMFKALSVLSFFTRAKGREGEGREERKDEGGKEIGKEGRKRKGRKMDKRKTESSLGAEALGEPETACLAHSEPWVHPQHHTAWVERQIPVISALLGGEGRRHPWLWSEFGRPTFFWKITKHCGGEAEQSSGFRATKPTAITEARETAQQARACYINPRT